MIILYMLLEVVSISLLIVGPVLGYEGVSNLFTAATLIIFAYVLAVMFTRSDPGVSATIRKWAEHKEAIGVAGVAAKVSFPLQAVAMLATLAWLGHWWQFGVWVLIYCFLCSFTEIGKRALRAQAGRE